LVTVCIFTVRTQPSKDGTPKMRFKINFFKSIGESIFVIAEWELVPFDEQCMFFFPVFF